MKFKFCSWIKRILSTDEVQVIDPVLHQFDGLDFRVHSISSEPYNLVDPSMHTTTCNGYSLDSKILRCSFELIQIQGSILRVNHFAVQGDWIGDGRAEVCLRAFAQLIAEQAPHINTIQFSLYKVRIRQKVSQIIEQKLEEKAKSLKGQLPDDQIKLATKELKTQLEDAQAIKLAGARKSFLTTLGAETVHQTPQIRNGIGDLNITVSGNWPKEKWKLTEHP
ncbi:hypothetical protein OH460_07930 [Vibrio sp. Makdt]|uniref:hypothetical protein n=1 Tax=Vibrio sp. Makdt TaxID=2998828 RepID=UPI0022CD7788|nr:hypothetical protein [Vibrio sp. Makdt]MDA0152226.1 hypothetical protein [Vibrio sp. Makdt]